MNDLLMQPFRQLVERRLWPVALLLVGALAAVPIMLARDSEVEPPPSMAALPEAHQAETQPIVAISDPAARDSVRRVLGTPKNPFRPAIKAQKATATPAPPAVDRGSSGSGSGSGGGGGGTGAQPPAAPRPTFELYSLQVRFGESTGSLSARTLKRLTALPGAGNPKLIYMGLLQDNRTAVFLVDAGATVQGDGVCKPRPDDCQTLRMRPGDTVFIDVPGRGGKVRQYQLDLVKVHVSTTQDTGAAEAARAEVDKRGAQALPAVADRIGPYRYDVSTGTLEVIPAREWKAIQQRLSAARSRARSVTPAPAAASPEPAPDAPAPPAEQ